MSVLDEARAWLADDPDPDTRAELEALVRHARTGDPVSAADLAERFSGPLEFGTAGIRGAMGAGPRRMNRAVVMRTAAGLAAHLGGEGLVVVGYDARRKSSEFAAAAAQVLAGAGLRAVCLPRALPTPVLAFAVRHLGAAAGVMVTASHNPPQDNGCKVYLGDGRQIVPPDDAAIAARIAAVGRVSDLPLGAPQVAGEDLVEAYVAAVASLAADGTLPVTVAYTPMHGVGRDVLLAVLARAGFADPVVVPEQAEPDPAFPTVAFPNPEEPGAMDLALALGAGVGASLVVANDPDADRCAVAVPARAGGWRVLRGDELGALLGRHVARRGVAPGSAFACSIVSSSLLGKVAAAHGLRYARTLTGFKWISRVEGLAYGYEEALGYCVDPQRVADKDGVSAALLAVELAAECAAQGRTLEDELDDLARDHGLHATDQLSLRVRDLALIPAAVARLRDDPPSTLGGLAVHEVRDLAEGWDGLPPTDGLRFGLQDDAWVVVRPSGTEPKLKCYLEVVLPVSPAATAGELDAARARARTVLDAVKGDLGEALGL
ncbi:phospho-sugar mutase [Vallicoccus soli]|uniref:Phospho-sugar mutase n=1 Tax=Vallicoccus soli TaxID=2339232 RepID=A0A3A3ZIH1_9ACTN|nr:phospho-sugar mutase [Vallicoccus soli]RJK95306.1 phospho-sugar mutase [Vallicoccus soli]